MTTIVAENLSKAYGPTPVLIGLELDLRSGERLAVLGPSGSGKTTLLRLIAGLDYPDVGQLMLDNEVVSRPGWVLEPNRRSIGLVFQSGALWPHMTVEGNVMFGLQGIDRQDARARTASLLDAAGLEGLARRYPDQLSAGQARRVALVRALAPEPRILLLDEPLTNVEPELRERLATLILAEVERTKATTMHVTHEPAEASVISDRQAVLEGGRLRPP